MISIPKYSCSNCRDKFMIVHIDKVMWESDSELEEDLAVCQAIANDIDTDLPCHFWDKDGYLIAITRSAASEQQVSD